MKHYLVKYEGNWADEFNIYFHQIMNEEELKEAKELVGTTDWEEEEFYFGTNEWMDFSSPELLDALNNAIELNDDQVKALTDLQIEYICFGDDLNWDTILNRVLDE